MIEAMLRIFWKLFRQVETDASQSRRTDGHEKCFNRFVAGTQILKTGFDQIGSG